MFLNKTHRIQYAFVYCCRIWPGRVYGAPKRSAGLKSTRRGNAVQYKEADDMQTKRECKIDGGSEDVEQKGCDWRKEAKTNDKFDVKVTNFAI